MKEQIWWVGDYIKSIDPESKYGISVLTVIRFRPSDSTYDIIWVKEDKPFIERIKGDETHLFEKTTVKYVPFYPNLK